MMNPDVFATRGRHGAQPVLIHEDLFDFLTQSVAFNRVVKAMHTVQKRLVTPNGRIVDHRDGPRGAGLIVPVTIPAEALGRPHQPRARCPLDEFLEG